jgi:NADH-quinone oxidoreductase subunit F
MPLLMANPHVLVEGVIIAAYAIRAKHAFIYIRGEVTHVRIILSTQETFYLSSQLFTGLI